MHHESGNTESRLQHLRVGPRRIFDNSNSNESITFVLSSNRTRVSFFPDSWSIGKMFILPADKFWRSPKLQPKLVCREDKHLYYPPVQKKETQLVLGVIQLEWISCLNGWSWALRAFVYSQECVCVSLSVRVRLFCIRCHLNQLFFLLWDRLAWNVTFTFVIEREGAVHCVTENGTFS